MSDSDRDRTVRLADLARDLHVDYRTLRGWVSRTFPRAASDVWQPWVLGAEQVRAARNHFSAREVDARLLPGVQEPARVADARLLPAVEQPARVADARLLPAVEQPVREVLVHELPSNSRTGGPPLTVDWFWEGNVVVALARALAADGWIVRRTADTGRREQGVDLVAERGHRTLIVEVKGYPTTTYARGPKAGQTKPTLPVSQARQWFSHAVLECLLMRSKYPDAEIAMAFPRMATYLRLIERVRPSLVRLGFGVYVIASDGSAQVLVAPGRPQ